jgi:hypothetical protein
MPVSPNAPGVRRRTAYVEELTARSTWRSRLDAEVPVTQIDATDIDASVG